MRRDELGQRRPHVACRCGGFGPQRAGFICYYGVDLPMLCQCMVWSSDRSLSRWVGFQQLVELRMQYTCMFWTVLQNSDNASYNSLKNIDRARRCFGVHGVASRRTQPAGASGSHHRRDCKGARPAGSGRRVHVHKQITRPLDGAYVCATYDSLADLHGRRVR